MQFNATKFIIKDLRNFMQHKCA